MVPTWSTSWRNWCPFGPFQARPGLLRLMDTATAYLLADARSRGMSARQYAATFGIVLEHGRREIHAHELSTPLPHEPTQHCKACAPARHECE